MLPRPAVASEAGRQRRKPLKQTAVVMVVPAMKVTAQPPSVASQEGLPRLPLEPAQVPAVLVVDLAAATMQTLSATASEVGLRRRSSWMQLLLTVASGEGRPNRPSLQPRPVVASQDDRPNRPSPTEAVLLPK